MSRLVVVILAAGQGKRMRSRLPKVLHGIAGRTLLEFAVSAARDLDPDAVHVVYGHGGEQVPETLAALDVSWVKQHEQLGTGHAVAQAMPAIPDGAAVLVLYGDVPLVAPRTLRRLVALAEDDGVGLLTVNVDDPRGYGRIVRGSGGLVRAIVEDRDASESERGINEINTGMLAAPARRLRAWVAGLNADNVQREYYLTDVIGRAVREGVAVTTVHPARVEEVLGVNDRVQLAGLERAFQRREAERLMRAGVTLSDPARIDVRGEVTVGEDVTIDINVILAGRVVIGDGVRIGPHTVIADTELGPDTHVHANSVIEGATIGRGCNIGPFARIRPGTHLAEEVRVGNFVELKKTRVGPGSKINHLSYVGDAEMGRGVNIGAGTITCNYDGANKHRTVIGDDVFIGSGAELVAPVTIGTGATVGAGSTVTRDAPANQLTVARSRQKSIEGWRRPVKK